MRRRAACRRALVHLALLGAALLGAVLPGAVRPGAGRAAAAEGRPHLIAIAACPPWVSFGDPAADAFARGACRNAIDSMSAAATRRLGVAPADITRLLDAAATRQAVEDALAGARRAIGPDDRLYVYLNLHGGPSAGRYRGYPVVDETLALWTTALPAAPFTEHGFIFVRTLRDLILAVPAREIVILVDSCRSGLGFDDFRYVPRALERAGRRVAVVFSAGRDQLAHFTPDRREALFTRMFAAALEVSPADRLSRAVALAAEATRATVRAQCARRDTASDAPPDGLSGGLSDGLSGAEAFCSQRPRVFDPHGLLDAIVLAAGPVAPRSAGPVPGPASGGRATWPAVRTGASAAE